MKISVIETINDGNIGEGWTDNYEAAKAYAAHLGGLYRAALREEFGVDAELDIDVRAARNVSGVQRFQVCVERDGDPDPTAEQLAEQTVEHVRDTAWNKWSNSTESEQYAA